MINYKAVYKRDENKCQSCGSRANLSVHHIQPISKRPDLKDELSNLIILCKNCHQFLHGIQKRNSKRKKNKYPNGSTLNSKNKANHAKTEEK